jgi:hypothetical protein
MPNTPIINASVGLFTPASAALELFAPALVVAADAAFGVPVPVDVALVPLMELAMDRTVCDVFFGPTNPELPVFVNVTLLEEAEEPVALLPKPMAVPVAVMLAYLPREEAAAGVSGWLEEGPFIRMAEEGLEESLPPGEREWICRLMGRHCSAHQRS